MTKAVEEVPTLVQSLLAAIINSHVSRSLVYFADRHLVSATFQVAQPAVQCWEVRGSVIAFSIVFALNHLLDTSHTLDSFQAHLLDKMSSEWDRGLSARLNAE